MLEKDQTILQFIDRLKTIVDFNDIEIVDHWDADLCGIGFRRDNKLVFISTYHHTETNPVYDYELEFIDNKKMDKVKTYGSKKGIEEKELVEAIRTFLAV